jgi:hypothetical protein
MIKAGLIAVLCAWSLCAQGKVLYTGSSVPSSQGWFGPLAGTQTLDAAGFVTLDTTAASAVKAGYGLIEPLLTSTAPGVRLDFTLKLESETHNSNDRSGLSIIVTDQTKHGIEIGFWSDRVWAQQLGFSHGAEALFNTDALTDYSLTIIGGTYSLAAGGTSLLSGSTLFYDAPGLPPPFSDIPYRTAHIVFLGDDTTSASAKFDLKSVSLSPAPEPAVSLLLCVGLALLVLAVPDSNGRARALRRLLAQRESNLLWCLASDIRRKFLTNGNSSPHFRSLVALCSARRRSGGADAEQRQSAQPRQHHRPRLADLSQRALRIPSIVSSR